MLKRLLEGLWAGSETSLHAHLELEAQIAAKISAGWQPDSKDKPDDEDLPRLLSVQGGVGVISIKGSLTNGEDSLMAEYFGYTPYGAIREALLAAASHPDVKHILLDVDSGGGSVAGVSDVGSLIAMVGKKVKPVTTFTDGVMASAAYWLGCSAGEIYASNVAVVGSIGVLAVHKEYSEAYKQAGVGVTVVRSGKYKAMANSIEPLSNEAEAQIQNQIDAVDKVFVDHVAAALGKSYDHVKTNLAQGKEFVGQQAMDVGLVNGITSFDALFQRIQQEVVDKDAKRVENSRQFHQTGTNMKTALTAEQIAAMAEGGVPVGEAPAPVVPEATAPEAPAAEAPAEEPAAPEAPAPAAAASDLTVFLTSQIKEKDAALVSAMIQVSELTKQLAAVGGLMAIAAKSVNNMQIALGQSASAMAGLDAATVLAEHQRLSADFQAKFKAGGVAAVDAAAPEAKSNHAQPQTALAAARAHASRLSK